MTVTEGEGSRGVINSLPLPDVVQQALASSDDAQKDVLGDFGIS